MKLIVWIFSLILLRNHVRSEENVCSGILQKRFRMSCTLVAEINEENNDPSNQCKQPAVIENDFRMECKLVEMDTTGPKPCQEGWIQYQQSCYLFWNKTSQGFHAAATMCVEIGAHLVFVETETENNFIKQKLKSFTSNHWWMGITDEEKEGTYRYFGTNTSIVFSDWIPGNPDNGRGGGPENCVHYWNAEYDYKWNDNPCIRQKYAICEKQNK